MENTATNALFNDAPPVSLGDLLGSEIGSDSESESEFRQAMEALPRHPSASPFHFVSRCCVGETCRVCGEDATHKLGEEIPIDDPLRMRHNLTAYVCCVHFAQVVGPAAPCVPDLVSAPVIGPHTLAQLRKEEQSLRDDRTEARDWMNAKHDDFCDNPSRETAEVHTAAVSSFHSAVLDLARARSEMAGIACLNLTESEGLDLSRRLCELFPSVAAQTGAIALGIAEEEASNAHV